MPDAPKVGPSPVPGPYWTQRIQAEFLSAIEKGYPAPRALAPLAQAARENVDNAAAEDAARMALVAETARAVIRLSGVLAQIGAGAVTDDMVSGFHEDTVAALGPLIEAVAPPGEAPARYPGTDAETVERYEARIRGEVDAIREAGG